jgi:hypothetical protein
VYKRQLIPNADYFKNSKFFVEHKLETNNVPKKSPENRLQNLKLLLIQYWLGSTYSNQILKGDPFIAFKNDFKDNSKRNRTFNAAVNTIEVLTEVPEFNLKPSSTVKFVVVDSDKDKVYKEKDGKGSSIDADDAQTTASLEFWWKHQSSQGKAAKVSYNNYLKAQAGVSITEAESDVSVFHVLKTAGAEGNQVHKHGQNILLPKEVAQIIPSTLEEATINGYYFDEVSKILKIKSGEITEVIYRGYLDENGEIIINKLIPFDHRPDLFNTFAILAGYVKTENGLQFNEEIDYAIPITAIKGAQKNVIATQDILSLIHI